jgi:MHS family proline/betaine transporter-like MFS transporter
VAALLKLHSHQKSLLITLIPLVVYLIALPMAGYLADRTGISKQLKYACVLYLMCSYAVFSWLPFMNAFGCMAILAFYAMIQALLNAALPAYIVSQFKINQRGKALAISYNPALTLFGGLMSYLLLMTSAAVNQGIIINLCAALNLLVMNQSRRKHDYLRSKPVCG